MMLSLVLATIPLVCIGDLSHAAKDKHHHGDVQNNKPAFIEASENSINKAHHVTKGRATKSKGVSKTSKLKPAFIEAAKSGFAEARDSNRSPEAAASAQASQDSFTAPQVASSSAFTDPPDSHRSIMGAHTNHTPAHPGVTAHVAVQADDSATEVKGSESDTHVEHSAIYRRSRRKGEEKGTALDAALTSKGEDYHFIIKHGIFQLGCLQASSSLLSWAYDYLKSEAAQGRTYGFSVQGSRHGGVNEGGCVRNGFSQDFNLVNNMVYQQAVQATGWPALVRTVLDYTELRFCRRPGPFEIITQGTGYLEK